MALFGRVIERLPEGECFGSSAWWKADEDLQLELDATVSGEGLVILAGATLPGFHWEWVRLRLSESGARGEAFFAMDVLTEALRDLAGVAVLLTDGPGPLPGQERGSHGRKNDDASSLVRAEGRCRAGRSQRVGARSTRRMRHSGHWPAST